jgi:hypothetical protein
MVLTLKVIIILDKALSNLSMQLTYRCLIIYRYCLFIVKMITSALCHKCSSLILFSIHSLILHLYSLAAIVIGVKPFGLLFMVLNA